MQWPKSNRALYFGWRPPHPHLHTIGNPARPRGIASRNRSVDGWFALRGSRMATPKVEVTSLVVLFRSSRAVGTIGFVRRQWLAGSTWCAGTLRETGYTGSRTNTNRAGSANHKGTKIILTCLFLCDALARPARRTQAQAACVPCPTLPDDRMTNTHQGPGVPHS